MAGRRRRRRNPGGDSALLASIKRDVAARASEGAQVNAIAVQLGAHGWLKKPDVRKGTYGRGSTLRIYVYEGTPAGDFVLLAGPGIIGEVRSLAELDAKDAAKGFYVETEDPGSRASKIAEASVARAKKAGARSAKGSKVDQAVKRTRTIQKARRAPAAPARPRGGMDYRIGAPSRPQGTQGSPVRRRTHPGSSYEPIQRPASGMSEDEKNMAEVEAMLERITAKLLAD